jgi:hypothetical protein
MDEPRPFLSLPRSFIVDLGMIVGEIAKRQRHLGLFVA